MPFLWLKSSRASHISLENYKSLNLAYMVLRGWILLMASRLHAHMMLWSCWHVLQVLSFLQADEQALPSSWCCHLAGSSPALKSHIKCHCLRLPALHLSHLMYFSFITLTANCDCNLCWFLWLINVFPACYSLSSIREGMDLFCSALCTQHTEQYLNTP